jgi:hypothetical protein
MEGLRFVAAHCALGYDGTASIEHENWARQRTVAQVKRGFLISRDVLRPLVHQYQPSPRMGAQLAGLARRPLGAYCRLGRNLYPYIRFEPSST